MTQIAESASIIPHHSANVEFVDFDVSFLIDGHTGRGTKMFYDGYSSSMNFQSNDRTDGICSPDDVPP